MDFKAFTSKYGTDGPKAICLSATHWDAMTEKAKAVFFQFVEDLQSAAKIQMASNMQDFIKENKNK